MLFRSDRVLKRLASRSFPGEPVNLLGEGKCRHHPFRLRRFHSHTAFRSPPSSHPAGVFSHAHRSTSCRSHSTGSSGTRAPPPFLSVCALPRNGAHATIPDTVNRTTRPSWPASLAPLPAAVSERAGFLPAGTYMLIVYIYIEGILARNASGERPILVTQTSMK